MSTVDSAGTTFRQYLEIMQHYTTGDVEQIPVGVGTSWNEKQKVAGRIIEFVAKITELDRPRKYAMNMVIPGGKGILVTTFEPENDGTLMTRVLDDTLPGAFFGQLAEKLLFDRFVKKSLRETAATLKIVLESRQNSQ